MKNQKGFVWLPVLLVILGVLVVSGGAYFVTHQNSQPQTLIYQEQTTAPTTTQASASASNTTAWKTYQDENGFKIKYPPGYSVNVSTKLLQDSSWMTAANYLTVYAPGNVTALSISLSRQPVIYRGEVYHAVADYWNSGKFWLSGIPDPKGSLVSINGTSAILYHIPKTDEGPTGGTKASDLYLFIANDFIYSATLNLDDPYHDEIIQSVSVATLNSTSQANSNPNMAGGLCPSGQTWSGPISSGGCVSQSSPFSVSPDWGKPPLTVTTASFDGCNSQLTWGDNTDTWYSGYAMQSCGAGSIHPMITQTHTYTTSGFYTISLYLNPPPANPVATTTVNVYAPSPGAGGI